MNSTEVQSIDFTGSQLGICLMAMTLAYNMPFDKTTKPVDLAPSEIETICQRILAIIHELRAAEFDQPLHQYPHPINFDLSPPELQLTIRSIEAVLQEWESDPLELDMLVGKPEMVRDTLEWLRTC